MKHFRQTIHQPQQIFAALILTGVLSLGASMTCINAATANSLESPQGVAPLKQRDDAKLPQSVADAVFNAASQRTGLPKNELSIVQFQQIQGSSSCLGISPTLGEMCTADLVPLWQVTVAGGQHRLVYHTSWDGSQIKLNQTASWKIKTLAASSLLMIVPLLGFYVYRRKVS